MDKLGRKFFLVAGTISAGICSAVMYFVKNKIENLIVSATFSAVISCANAALDCLITEVFPTHLRATGVAISMVFARLGGIIGNGKLHNFNSLLHLILTFDSRFSCHRNALGHNVSGAHVHRRRSVSWRRIDVPVSSQHNQKSAFLMNLNERLCKNFLQLENRILFCLFPFTCLSSIVDCKIKNKMKNVKNIVFKDVSKIVARMWMKFFQM